ncbi:hypothetical protein BLA29_004959, partial [Euroglyphus maynei]
LGDDNNHHHNREDDGKLLEKIAHDDIGFGGPSKWTIQMNEPFDMDDDNELIEEEEKKFEIRTAQLTDPMQNNDDSLEQEKPTLSNRNDPKKSNINEWKKVDKKKAATESELRSTIKKFNEKTKKEKRAIVAAANVADDIDDEEANTVQLQWEFSKNSNNKTVNKKKK